MKHLQLLICLLVSFLTAAPAAFSNPEPQSSSLQLELPRPPASLTTPGERASWLSLHYWDNLDFVNDSGRAESQPFLESNFSTWADLLDHVTDTMARKKSVEGLVVKASTNPDALAKLVEIAEIYLYDPRSPFADEGKYRLWVETLLKSGGLDDIESIRPSMQLEEMKVNPVGGKASDFSLTLPDGSRRTLYDIVGEISQGIADNRDILLFFYDPDCHDCSEAIPVLAAMENNDPDSPAIVAVCVEGTEEDWATKRSTMPAQWVHAYAADILSQSLDEQGPYILPVMPTFYLVSPDGTIKTKNWRP